MSITKPEISIEGVDGQIDLTEPDFNVILDKLKRVVLDEAITVADFFDGALYSVPTIEMSTENCQNKLTSILQSLQTKTEGILVIIKINISDPSYSNTYKLIIRNFNQIKVVFSRIYVCCLVYKNKHAVVTSDYENKITELKKLLKETTLFLLNLDEISEQDFAARKNLRWDEPTLAMPPKA